MSAKGAAELSVFSSVEFCLWDANDDATNFQRNFSTGQVEVEDEVIYHKTEYRERRNHFAWFACSEPLAGFDTQREAFLGPWRGWDRPQAVEPGTSSNSIAHGWSPIGSHHVKVRLKPGETRQHPSSCSAISRTRRTRSSIRRARRRSTRSWSQPKIAQYRDRANADAAFDRLRAYWDGLLGIFQVASPDAHANRMVNIWNAYQCMATFNMSRSASTFESGIGRGLGFRDSNQDLLGFVHMVPERARQRILDLAATQLASGGAYHQYQPLTKKGNDDVGGNFNDDPHWLIIGVAAISEGNRRLRDPRRAGAVRHQRRAAKCRSTSTCARSIQYALDRLGPHGLPLIGRADWNDCLNLNCFSANAGRVLPDHDQQGRQGRRIGVHRRPVRACGARNWPAIAERARQAGATPRNYRDDRRQDGRNRARARLGRRVVPARL